MKSLTAKDLLKIAIEKVTEERNILPRPTGFKKIWK